MRRQETDKPAFEELEEVNGAMTLPRQLLTDYLKSKERHTIVSDFDETLIHGEKGLMPGVKEFLEHVHAASHTCFVIATHGALQGGKKEEGTYIGKYDLLQKFKGSGFDVPSVEPHDIAASLDGVRTHPREVLQLPQGMDLLLLLSKYGKGAKPVEGEQNHLKMAQILRDKGTPLGYADDVDQITMIGDSAGDMLFAIALEKDLREKGIPVVVQKILFQHPDIKDLHASVLSRSEVQRNPLEYEGVVICHDVRELEVLCLERRHQVHESHSSMKRFRTFDFRPLEGEDPGTPTTSPSGTPSSGRGEQVSESDITTPIAGAWCKVVAMPTRPSSWVEASTGQEAATSLSSQRP